MDDLHVEGASVLIRRGALCRRTGRCIGRAEHPRSARLLGPPLNDPR